MKKKQRASLFFTLAMMAAGMFIAALAVAQNTDAQKKAATTTSTTTTTEAAKDKNKSTLTPRDASTGMTSGKQAAATVQPYKDPEDMTTRAKSAQSKIPPTAPTGDAAEAKKHIAGVKYEDRQASGQTLDGASKDAAKSVTAPENGQDSKRVNKVDGFTVKQ